MVEYRLWGTSLVIQTKWRTIRAVPSLAGERAMDKAIFWVWWNLETFWFDCEKSVEGGPSRAMGCDWWKSGGWNDINDTKRQ